MSKQIIFKKVTTGEFDVLVDGVKAPLHITNGSRGASGRGSNMYGITSDNGNVRWFGSLQACKKIVIHTISKESA